MSCYKFITGSYTRDTLVPGSCGEGVRLWEFDSANGNISLLATCSDISNPSWVAVDPSGKLAAVASEHMNGASQLCLMAIGDDRGLRVTDAVGVGDAVCHAAFSQQGHHVAAAAYMAGQAYLIGCADGRFSGAPMAFGYSGSGPDARRQEAPHAHQVVFSPDGRFLYVTDLGSDRIWVHAIDKGTFGDPCSACVLPAGCGPRHMAIDTQRALAFAMAELTAQVHILSMDLENGRLQHIGSVPSLPDDWQSTPSGAAIRLHPSLPFLYVSNRNGGIITVFRIGNEAAPLQLVDMQRVDDPTPRDFNISPDGKWLLLAGQQSHRLMAHPIDLASGRIGPAAVTVPCGSPVCIAWLPH